MKSPDKQIFNENQCTKLCTDFAFFVDAREYEKVIDMFVEDGVLVRLGTAFRGREEILRFMQSRPTSVETHHICANIRITPRSDGTALGHCSVLMYHRHDGSAEAPSLTIAQYSDVYVETSAGWKIKERIIELVFK